MSEFPRMWAAVPEDYDSIVGVLDEWWGRPIQHILPRLFLDHHYSTSLISQDEDGLAGFLVGFFSPLPSQAYIHCVGVAPRLRGSGLGRQLYERFFELAAADRRTVIQAITSSRNHPSIAFHVAMGFTVSAPIADYNGPGTERVVTFELHLHPQEQAAPNNPC